jgi:glycerate dehydrogenase
MSDPLRIVFLDAATLEREGDVSFDLFSARWPCVFHPLTSAGQTAERVKDAQVAVTNKVVFDARLLGQSETAGLKLIAVAATGTNNVDLDAAKKRGLAVCNVKGYSGASVAEQAFALILELTHRVGLFAQETREGVWSRSPMFVSLTHSTYDLADKTLGLIGFGDIARRLAQIAEACGMNVLYHARHEVSDAGTCRRVTLDELLRTADAISVHCPLTPETRDLIGSAQFAVMKPGAILVNTARGGIVNELALVDALRSGRLGGAGVDVLTQEPPPATHPLVIASREFPNLLITPHNAWATVDARRRLVNELYENILAFEKGERRNRVV